MSLWSRAGELSQQGKLLESQRMYEMAYDLRADPRLLFNIARVLHKRGLMADAAAHYESFLNSSLDDPVQKAKARAYLDEARTSLASAASQKPTLPSIDQAPRQGTESALAGVAAATRPSDAGTPAQPLYKKWWLWTTVGLVAAGAIGLGLGLGLERPRNPYVDGVWR